MKKYITSLAVAVVSSYTGFAAQVDMGLTLGVLLNNSSTVQNSGLFELGTFSGYSDGSGAGFFTGKNYTTLRNSFTSFGILDSAATTTDASGNFYGSFNLGSTTAGTRLFSWVFSTTTPQESANWSIVSGTIGGTTDYDPVWLAVAPTDITVNVIEIGVTSNVLYANNNAGNALLPITPTPSANLSVIPEPSTYALMALGGLVVFFISRRRKAQQA